MYDIGIVGGGLAGLSSAIQLSRAGLNVVLIEKKAYPFHRVCGEYISMEVVPFLNAELGFDPFEHGAVELTRLQVSSPKGTLIELPLDLGGFGLSRYKMDQVLRDLAIEYGVNVLEKTNVLDIQQQKRGYSIQTNKNGELQAKLVIGAFGKRSNLDRSLKRASFYNRSPYIGVKHHIRINGCMDDDVIALHNFKDGYCGISRVEEDVFCLCYLSHRKNIKQSGNIPKLEHSILKRNPYLDAIFNKAEFLWDKPLVINEISFDRKQLRENGVWFVGDSSGMIAPLCGNGMAMALHGSYLLSQAVLRVFDNNISAKEAFMAYRKGWQQAFAARLNVGRNIQKMFGDVILSELLIGTAKTFPMIGKQLVKLTHGKDFLKKNIQ